jgi:hypothetical protein
MRMLMGFGFVSRVVVLVSAVFIRMLVFMILFIAGMGVLVRVFVRVLVNVNVLMLVRVRLIPVAMLVGMFVCVLVRMLVLVRVVAFHDPFSFGFPVGSWFGGGSQHRVVAVGRLEGEAALAAQLVRVLV